MSAPCPPESHLALRHSGPSTTRTFPPRVRGLGHPSAREAETRLPVPNHPTSPHRTPKKCPQVGLCHVRLGRPAGRSPLQASTHAHTAAPAPHSPPPSAPGTPSQARCTCLKSKTSKTEENFPTLKWRNSHFDPPHRRHRKRRADSVENGRRETHLRAGGRGTERMRAGPDGLRPALHLRIWL